MSDIERMSDVRVARKPNVRIASPGLYLRKFLVYLLGDVHRVRSGLFLYDDHTTFRAVVERLLRTFLDTVFYTGHVTQIYVLSVLATDH